VSLATMLGAGTGGHKGYWRGSLVVKRGSLEGGRVVSLFLALMLGAGKRP